MNLDKTLGFGYHVFGNHIIVKINCKLTDEQEDDLQRAYPSAHIYNNGRYGTRINHVLLAGELKQFQKTLANMLIDKKILDLIGKKNIINALGVNVY